MQERPRGATPRPRSGVVTRRVTPCLRPGAVAGRRYPMPQACGRGRWMGGATPRPHARGQGRRPGGATPRPRSHDCAGAGGPRGTIPRLRSGRVAVRRYPSSKVRRNGWGSREETPHAQGKKNPSKMVGIARGHQRANTLKPYSQKTSQSNHTRTTALSNSMKLSHACGATQDGQVMV